jgi:hypothetical protein
MPNNISHQPRPVPQVMVSSTFNDLKEHRAAIIQAINKHKLHPNVMEHDDAKLSHDVIDSSLQMVRDSAAYILVISLKYGKTPDSTVNRVYCVFNSQDELKEKTAASARANDRLRRTATQRTGCGWARSWCLG